jgi:hypothetical protein
MQLAKACRVMPASHCSGPSRAQSSPALRAFVETANHRVTDIGHFTE